MSAAQSIGARAKTLYAIVLSIGHQKSKFTIAYNVLHYQRRLS